LYFLIRLNRASVGRLCFSRFRDVQKDGNAAKAGAQAGGFLESCDCKKPLTIEGLRNVIKIAEEEDRKHIPVLIFRGTERMEKKLDPGRMGLLLEVQQEETLPPKHRALRNVQTQKAIFS
jgi:hypothetical protein